MRITSEFMTQKTTDRSGYNYFVELSTIKVPTVLRSVEDESVRLSFYIRIVLV